jgi:S-adenosylmethionine:tRNA ribosyltransferase-isomerase
MRVDEFDFALPEERIALRPVEPRDSARLMVVDGVGRRTHRYISDLPDLLLPSDCLVLNDTKVINARLRGRRIGRGDTSPKIEVLLHRRIAKDEFLAFARPARKLVAGDKLQLGSSLIGSVVKRGDGGEIELKFTLSGHALDLQIEAQGEVPLPPYIAGKRPADDRDRRDYQTVFAHQNGSVAAHTAGLHFTPDLLHGLAQRGIGRDMITLHVGAGTFLPVSSDDTMQHHMHPEWLNIDSATAARLNKVREGGGRIVAVGTTSLRALETAATETGEILPYSGETDIFITPGYRFKAVDVLLTNFHLPRSTLFMLASAFCGLKTMRDAYAEAIQENYRFYSYGDACLLFRPAS